MKFDDRHPVRPQDAPLDAYPLSVRTMRPWIRNAAMYTAAEYAGAETPPDHILREAADVTRLCESDTYVPLREGTDFESPIITERRMAPVLWMMASIRVRPVIVALTFDQVVGQTRPARYAVRWMANWPIRRITVHLRRRKRLLAEGLASPNDPPSVIYGIYQQAFPDETDFDNILEPSGAGSARADGIMASAVTDGVLYPPESRKCGDFTFSILAKDDRRNITIGSVNDSCMQIGSLAEGCIADAVSNPLSAILSISDGRRTIGHSWIRTGTSGRTYLDNVELVEEHAFDFKLSLSLAAWCVDVAREWNRTIVVGAKHSYVNLGEINGHMSLETYSEEFPGEEVYSDLKDADTWAFLSARDFNRPTD